MYKDLIEDCPLGVNQQFLPFSGPAAGILSCTRWEQPWVPLRGEGQAPAALTEAAAAALWLVCRLEGVWMGFDQLFFLESNALQHWCYQGGNRFSVWAVTPLWTIVTGLYWTTTKHNSVCVCLENFAAGRREQNEPSLREAFVLDP